MYFSYVYIFFKHRKVQSLCTCTVYVTIILIDERVSSDYSMTGMTYAFKSKKMAREYALWCRWEGSADYKHRGSPHCSLHSLRILKTSSWCHHHVNFFLVPGWWSAVTADNHGHHQGQSSCRIYSGRYSDGALRNHSLVCGSSHNEWADNKGKVENLVTKSFYHEGFIQGINLMFNHFFFN